MRLKEILAELKSENDVPYEDKIRVAAFYSSLIHDKKMSEVVHVLPGLFTPAHLVVKPQDAIPILEYCLDHECYTKYDRHIIDSCIGNFSIDNRNR